MIGRSLTRRLQSLESRFGPAGERQVITIEFVDKDRKAVERLDMTLASPAPNGPGQRTRRWQREPN